MKTITTSDDCLLCRECCKFPEEKRYFAPLFTAEEKETALRLGVGEHPSFHPHRGSASVYQVELQPSQQQAGLFVCPFLAEATNRCRIYPHHPFDCRIWPFLITRSRDGRSIHLVRFGGQDCPGLARLSAAELAAYVRYITAFVTRPSFLRFLRAHPELIWEEQDGSEHVADLTAALLDG